MRRASVAPDFCAVTTLIAALLSPVPGLAASVAGVGSQIIANQQLTTLAAEEQVKVNDRVEIRSSGGINAISGFRVQIGADALVDQVQADDRVVMRDRSSARLVAAPTLRVQNEVAVLQREFEAAAAQLREFVVANERELGSVITLPEQAPVRLPPADYGDLKVERGVELHLVSGDYLFDDFQVEPGGVLVLDETLGPIDIAVRGWVKWAGEVEHIGPNPRPLTMLFVTGSRQVSLERPLSFSVVAPLASVNVLPSDAQHVGSVWSRSVEVHQGSVVTTSTPCFSRACFWEPVPSTLAQDGVEELAVLVRRALDRQQETEALKDRAKELLLAFEAAQDDTERAQLASDQLRALQEQMNASLGAEQEMEQALLGMQAMIAGRQLSQVEAMADDPGCLGDRPSAAALRSSAQQLAQQLDSAVPQSQLQGLAIQPAALSAISLGSILIQTSALQSEAMAQAPDDVRCDPDLGIVNESSQSLLEQMSAALLEHDAKRQQIQDLFQQLEQATGDSQRAALVGEVSDASRTFERLWEVMSQMEAAKEAIIRALR